MHNSYQTVLGWHFHIQKWLKNGMDARVHVSEFEPKQPQLEPKPVGADPEGLPECKTCKNRISNSRFFT
jgi:hypothetical protein